MKKKVTPYHSS